MILTENEGFVRAAAFVSLLTIFALLEWLRPGRKLEYRKLTRWRNNFILLTCYTLLLRLAFPVALSGFALFWQQYHWGLLTHVTPFWLHIVLAILALDLVIYWQHRLMHTWPWLWHVHRVHHSDADLDVSTAVRFHPIEIALSLMVKILAVVILGVDPVAVIMFEVLLSSFALFNHSNVLLPDRLDRVLRWGCVTPNMHQIHHSVVWNEHNSNFGFAISWWDRIFRSYTASSEQNGGEFRFGLPQWKTRQYQFSSEEKISRLVTMSFDD